MGDSMEERECRRSKPTRKGSSSNLLLLFLSIAVILVGKCDGQTGSQTEDVDSALATHFNLLEAAAQHALDTYEMPPPPESGELMEATKEGLVQSAALFKETDDMCLVGYRGAETNSFNWVADIRMDRAYSRVAGSPRKRCRVVKHYKILYENKRMLGYKRELNAKLEACWDGGKTVVFVGHDLGGALATLGALEYAARQDMWAVTFGQPPVFMPASYRNPAVLSRSARRKNPCKHLNLNTYVPFHNSEIYGGFSSGNMAYDFMVFLNVLIYGMIENEQSGFAPSCLADAAAAAKAFLDDPGTKGNLGSQFGKRLLTPGEDAGSTNIVSWLGVQLGRDLGDNKRKIDFANQGNAGVTMSMLEDPELMSNSECTFPDLHKMETYAARLQRYDPSLTQNPNTLVYQLGFPEFERCNLASDCFNNAACTLTEGVGFCASSGAKTQMTGGGGKNK